MPVQHQGTQYHTHADVHAHVLEHGLVVPMSLALRQRLIQEGVPLPLVEGNIGIATPPHVGDGDPDLVDADGRIVEPGGPRCAHCGRRVSAEQNLRQHAPAGFEHTELRLLVRHCDECLDSDHCQADVSTPGAGLPAGCPGGYCEPLRSGAAQTVEG